MLITNYHSHSAYSDGKGNLEDFVKAAISKGVSVFGFSEHAPVSFDCEWTMSQEDLICYSQEIDYLKDEYRNQIELLKGLEVDYVPGNTLSTRKNIDFLNLDYFIGAVHFVDAFEDGYPWGIDTSEELFQKGLKDIFNDNIQTAVERYYELIVEMIDSMNPPIIAHLDKIAMYNIDKKYFDEQSDWHLNIVNNTLDYIQKKNLILEVNTRGFYKGDPNGFCPSPAILKECKKRDISVTLSSDCHEDHQIILGFKEAIAILKECGYSELAIIIDKKYSKIKII